MESQFSLRTQTVHLKSKGSQELVNWEVTQRSCKMRVRGFMVMDRIAEMDKNIENTLAKADLAEHNVLVLTLTIENMKKRRDRIGRRQEAGGRRGSYRGITEKHRKENNRMRRQDGDRGKLATETAQKCSSSSFPITEEPANKGNVRESQAYFPRAWPAYFDLPAYL